MNALKKNLQFGFALILSVLLISCSSDDDDGPSSLGHGEINLTLSGDIQGERSGRAEFNYASGSGAVWELNFHDREPRTFSLRLAIETDEDELPRPSPGTYEIGYDPENLDSVFQVVYKEIFDDDYNTFDVYISAENGGTLSIESSDGDWVVGSFEFTAETFDENMNVVGTIHVSGNFEANDRMLFL